MLGYLTWLYVLSLRPLWQSKPYRAKLEYHSTSQYPVHCIELQLYQGRLACHGSQTETSYSGLPVVRRIHSSRVYPTCPHRPLSDCTWSNGSGKEQTRWKALRIFIEYDGVIISFIGGGLSVAYSMVTVTPASFHHIPA